MSSEYTEVLRRLSKEILERDSFIELKKYPILIRTAKRKSKAKNINNMKPDDWLYFLQISYEPILDEREPLSYSTVMGIDRGLNHIIAVSVFNPAKSAFEVNRLYENDIRRWKLRKRKLMMSIQHLERKIRAQKGIHLHENQIKNSVRSIVERVENRLHVISKAIVDEAVAHNSVIILENLQGMKQHGRKRSKGLQKLNYALSQFDYQKLATLINYKAEYSGVKVYEIDASGTSQNCAKCLLDSSMDNGSYERGREIIDGRTNLTGNAKVGFCKFHGQIDADLNAARTIAVCFHRNLNNPRPFGSKKLYKKPIQIVI